MPKKITRDVARQVRQLSEEVVKEVKELPGGVARTAGEQIGILPRGWGEKPEAQLSTRMIQKKREEEEKELVFWRKRKRELETRQPELKKVPEEIEREKKLAEEEKERVPIVPSKKPRHQPAELLRIKKRRGTGEIRTGI